MQTVPSIPPPSDAPRKAAATRPNLDKGLAFAFYGLGGCYVVVFALLAWAPLERDTWLLENLVAAPLGLVLLFGRRRLPFGALSYAMLFAFLMLHAVGSHYTYSEVPYQALFERVLGWVPGGERNHFDRAVHLAFGLLVTWPLVELWQRWLPGRRRLALGVALLSSLSLSSLYELLEWGAARLSAPELGLAFVGAQGDVWDAQKDTALALLGAVLVACAVLACDRRRDGPAPPRDGPAASGKRS